MRSHRHRANTANRQSKEFRPNLQNSAGSVVLEHRASTSTFALFRINPWNVTATNWQGDVNNVLLNTQTDTISSTAPDEIYLPWYVPVVATAPWLPPGFGGTVDLEITTLSTVSDSGATSGGAGTLTISTDHRFTSLVDGNFVMFAGLYDNTSQVQAGLNYNVVNPSTGLPFSSPVPADGTFELLYTPGTIPAITSRPFLQFNAPGISVNLLDGTTTTLMVNWTDTNGTPQQIWEPFDTTMAHHLFIDFRTQLQNNIAIGYNSWLNSTMAGGNVYQNVATQADFQWTYMIH